MKIRNILMAASAALLALVAGACSSAPTADSSAAEQVPARPAVEVQIPVRVPAPAPELALPPMEPLTLQQQVELYDDMRQDIRDGSLERAQRRFRLSESQVHRLPGERAGEVYADLVLLSKYIDAMLTRHHRD